MKTQKETEQKALPILDGQITLEDILNNYDNGTYGKPVEEYEVK